MQLKIRSGLAGITYLLHNLAPLFVMCDINDLGAFSEPSCKLADGKPVILLYDAMPGGVGLAEAIFMSSNNLLTAALETINECECVDGCPSCVGVSGEFGTGGKAESKAILQHLLSGHYE